MYLLTTSHTHLLLTTSTSHTHRFHPLSKIVIHTSAHPYCTEVWMTILESGWNLWVWLVGVVSRRWVWLVVKRYIDILTIIINFPYSTCISSFLAAYPYFFVHFKNVFSFFLILLLLLLLLLLLILLLLILQWTYRDSVLSSDARLRVDLIYFLARRAVF